jgi:nicotinate dehydrogenase subunit B
MSTNTASNTLLSRRKALQAAGALVITLSTPTAFAQNRPAAKASKVKPALLPTEMDSWIAVDSNGHITAFFGKMDMGQGVDVAVGQMVAEELDVPATRVTVVMGDTALTCNQGGASGSTGVQRGGTALRNAAAEARRILMERAAQRLSIAVDKLQVTDGVISAIGNPAKQVSYAALVGGRYFETQIDWNGSYGNGLSVARKVQLKPRDKYKVIGTSVPRSDVAGKILGTMNFVTDVKVDGMLHGRVLRPPVAGAVPKTVDDSALKNLKSARVIRNKDFIGVVAENEWDAIRACELVKVTWSSVQPPFPAQSDLYDYIRRTPAIKTQIEVTTGNVDAPVAPGHRVIEAEYHWPFQSHACMGPACALVDVHADGAMCWSGSQKPHSVRDGLAALLGMPQDKVRVIWTPGPGSYGRNDAGDAAMDAAVFSQATGRPVRVQGMRYEGHGWDPKGPASIHRARAIVDADGKVVSYEFMSKGFSRTDVPPAESGANGTLAGMLLGNINKSVPAFGVPDESYGFENKKLGWEGIPPLLDGPSPLRGAHLRDPVGPQVHYASESFIDEIAAATKSDPVEFRLRYLKDPRHIAAIKAVAEKAGWKAGPPGARRKINGDLATGTGIAYAQRGGTIVAIVATVDVNRKTGRVWAKHFVVAHDCGLVINPGALRLCIEGNIVQGTSRALHEEVLFDRGAVTSTDWLSYPILDISDAPESIEIVLIDRPEIEPSGAGEPSIRAVAGAIANAVFDATGMRMRQAPFTPDRVKTALTA